MKNNVTIILMDICKILIIVIVIVIIIAIIYYLLARNQVSTFGPASNLGYAADNGPYDKPFIMQQLLTPEHCQKIIEYADGKLVDSEVVGGKIANIRNSQQTWIKKDNPLVRPLFEKISQMFDIPVENAEDLQVVRYQPNQFYNEHHDACCDSNTQCEDFVKKGGQRKLTVLVYLNNDFTEGNTYFKNLDLKVKPPVGDAIVFYPLAKNSNKCHPKALHAGMPVSSGEKWVANIWFRERAFY